MRRYTLLILVLATCVLGAEAASPRDGWNFRFKDFAIGAWWGPGASDAEMKLYKDAGFNIVMAGRYMQLDDYGHADKAVKELDLARKHGLAVMFDTYTKNDKPWGGKAGQLDGHPMHHAASLVELQWLHQRLGKHPALIGFMIGDDKSALTPRLIDCTSFLRKAAPHLMPWICQNQPNPTSLAEHGNPIFNPQIYPTLYQWQAPADALARSTCASFALMRRSCRQLDLMMWPMINIAGWQKTHGSVYLRSDSLVRFPIYAAVAYGAQGLWYFTYNGGAIQAQGTYATEADVKKALTPLYPIVREANLRLAAWGPRLLGRECVGLFATAWTGDAWPFDPPRGSVTREALTSPAPGRLVEAMSDRLLVGILTQPSQPPLAMIVDARVSKGWDTLKPREATVTFHSTVRSVAVLEGGKATESAGRTLTVTLPAGGGQLVELRGPYAANFATLASIYLPARCEEPDVVTRRITAADLKRIVAAKASIEVFGANAEAQYTDKRVSLNGVELGVVKANGHDQWDRRVVDLSPQHLALVRMANRIGLAGKGVLGDAWKCRGFALAVQLEDGSWARTTACNAVYGSPNWAHSEGTPFPTKGPVAVDLKFE